MEEPAMRWEDSQLYRGQQASWAAWSLEMTLILRKIQDAQAKCMEQTLQGLEEGMLKAERENIIQDCKSNSAEDNFKRHQAQKESLMPSSIDWEVWINWTILPDPSYRALGEYREVVDPLTRQYGRSRIFPFVR
jgi:hypothetical protein